MENKKHTPGPWIISSDGKSVRSVADIMANYRRNVVNVGKRDNAEEMSANLALCSAAPELLAALEALCAWHSHEALTGLPHGAPVASWAPSFDKTVKMVHAAIAKAKGAK